MVENNESCSVGSLRVCSLCNCRGLQRLLNHVILCVGSQSKDSDPTMVESL